MLTPGTSHRIVLWLRPLLALGVSVLAAACQDGPTGPVIDSPDPEPPTPASSGRPFYYGVFLGDSANRPGAVGPAIARFSTMTGHVPDLVKTYFTLDADFASGGLAGQVLLEITASGGTNLVALDLRSRDGPTTDFLAAIAAGALDSRIERAASALAGLGIPVLLEPAWEMNGNWAYPWQGAENGAGSHAPELFVSSWRHIVELFRSAGALNVRWVFSPNVGNPVGGPGAGTNHWNWYGHYYPGDEYVDFLGAHGFNAPTLWGGPYRGFATLFDGAEAGELLSDLASRFPDKPILISEFAAEETPGHDKGAWIEDAYRYLRTRPAIVGAIWFNMRKEADWRVDSSPSSLAAYRYALGGPETWMASAGD